MIKFIKRLLFLFALMAMFVGNFTFAGQAKANEGILSPKISSRDTVNVYTPGQNIRIDLNYGVKGLIVTADLSKIDQNWPQQYRLVDNNSGTYSLITPKISSATVNMVSDYAIVFTAKNSKGETNTTASPYKISIKNNPLILGADLKAPVRLSALAKDQQVTIWWSPVYNAKGITIYYYDENQILRRVFAPKNYSGITIEKLKNGFEYNFHVAGQAVSGSLGEEKVIKVKPVGPVIVEKAVEEKKETVKPAIKTTAQTVKPIEKKLEVKPQVSSDKIKESQTGNDQIAQDDQKQSKDNQNSVNWTRLLISLGILIAACALAVFLYYAYEKFTKKSKKNETKKDKSSNSRW